jgi:Cytochrome c554 and c-prime
MRAGFKDKEHLFRLVGLFAAGSLVFIGLQIAFVPEGFGVYGHFRTGALKQNEAHALVYAGHAACADCHSDVVEMKTAGKHAGVSCEACHGAHAAHAQDPAAAKGRRPSTRELCLVCHAPNIAKPKGFPQVEPDEHSGPGACTECHAPHSPGVS